MITVSAFVSICLGGLFLSIICGCVVDAVKLKKFKNQLKVGTRLRVCYFNNEPEIFDDLCFEIVLKKVGKDYVEAEYRDRSKRIFRKNSLYYERWKIISADK